MFMLLEEGTAGYAFAMCPPWLSSCSANVVGIAVGRFLGALAEPDRGGELVRIGPYANRPPPVPYLCEMLGLGGIALRIARWRRPGCCCW